jgi:RNA polymerase sigma-70 factor (ECF subfamily)
MDTTPASLLERLRQPAQKDTWERFVQLYTPLLCTWARRLGLHGEDVADLVQEVFTVLVQKLPVFRYDPQQRFRGWLWTILCNKCREKQRRPPLTANAPAGEPLPEPVSPDNTIELDEAEYRQYLTRRALELMQAEFEPATWKAFWEYVVHERPAAEVAQELGMTENAVYLTKGRVLRRLRDELQGLLD